MQVLLRRLWRISRLVFHLLAGVFLAAVMFGFYSAVQRDRVISRWADKVLRILNIRTIVSPSPEIHNGALLVANHISWLDIFILMSAKRVHFVSKHEVRSWPVIGWLAYRAGTLFIQRAKKSDTARINQEMHTLLQSGAWVAVFPEGTSTDGSRLLPFLPSLLQPAISENLPVVPAALRYTTPDGKHAPQAAYSDDISFERSLWNITGEPEIHAKLDFLAPVQGRSRRELADAAYSSIATSLGFLSSDNPPGTPAGLPGATR